MITNFGPISVVVDDFIAVVTLDRPPVNAVDRASLAARSTSVCSAPSAHLSLLAAKNPIALRLAKESMNRVEHLPLKDAYRTEQDYTHRLLGFEDSTEARRAFTDKRDPEWRWR